MSFALKCFEEYVDSLEELVHKTMVKGQEALEYSQVQQALGDQPMKVLSHTVPQSQRRATGSFFTGNQLGKLLVEGYKENAKTTWFDPACGAGDLLLASAQQLPLQQDLPSTITHWSKRLYGLDANPQFVRAAKARLILSAIARGSLTSSHSALPLTQIFHGLRVGDFLRTKPSIFRGISHVILNPPFSQVTALEDRAWGQGRVSAASLFVEKCLVNAPAGTHFAAILPDVLRSGSRYQRWRDRIASLGRIDRIVPYGLFDSHVDVDVFLLQVVAGISTTVKTTNWWNWVELPASHSTVGDLFTVKVGPVVPFRHPQEGPAYPYIHARCLPAWKAFNADTAAKRQFSGTTFSPPFVAVRRTSRPGMAFRAVGTVIRGDRPVAVENHLLVLQPRDGTVRSCRLLLEKLGLNATNEWLDNRIRCRHLTVSALSELPWWHNGTDDHGTSPFRA